MKQADFFNLRIPEYFNPLNPNFREIVIYGAGNTGKEVYKIMKKAGKNIKTFLDARGADYASYDGIPIIRPEDDGFDIQLKETALVIIAVFNRDTDLKPIEELLKRNRYKNIINFIQFHYFFADEIGDRFWLGNPIIYSLHTRELEEVESLWQDDESLSIFKSIMRFRMTGDLAELTNPEGQATQYFPRTIPLPSKPLRFIDGGAYDGDTLAAMAAKGIMSEAIACFEPDLKNFKKLSTYCTKHHKDFARQINLYPCAIWSRMEYLKFNGDGSEGSHVSDSENSITVLGASIDEIIPTFEPNFIKMDIEGAEFEGLLGARQTIAEFRPDLGICLYHTPDHLWKIPLLIKNWNLQYKFYLRAHAYNGLELVLYAKQAI